MKKISLFLSAIGGALAGYIFSNDTVRGKLAKAKSAEEAAVIFGKALKSDGAKVVTQLRTVAKSDATKQTIRTAKNYAKKTVRKASTGLKNLAKKGSMEAKKVLKDMSKSAQSKQR